MSQQSSSPVRGFASAVGLSLVALAWTAYAAWHDTLYTLGGMNRMIGLDRLGAALPGQIGAYVAALMLVYVVLGIAAHALVLATEAIFRWPPRRRPLHAGAWLVAMNGAAFTANARAFPASEFAVPPWTWLASIPAASALAWMLFAATCVLLLTAAGRWTLSTMPRRRTTMTLAATSTVAIAAGVAFARGPTLPVSTHGAQPHVIIVGIDSLRCDVTGATGTESLTPHIDRFLAASTTFADATSPLARTFPAWVSILTGRHPVSTNARFNLMPRQDVSEGQTLADTLKAHGYRAVYATDEVRFANFDASYGFDQLITPPVGAADFLLGTVNDLPWSNLLSATRAGALLFPHTYANRAAHVTYQPDRFIDRIERELDVTGPTFLTVHLTLAHWPYSWAGRPKPGTPPAYREAYRGAVRAVDGQFDELMRMLDAKGLLDDAIVVVLSDHGEALGNPGDSYLRGFADSQSLWNSLWGHGTSVVSPHQFGVVLAFRRIGGGAFATAGTRLDAPASLEDVTPTLLDLVAAPGPTDPDGISLKSLLEGDSPPPELLERVRFTETDFNTTMVLKGQYEEKGLIGEGAHYYEIAPASGWLQLRQDRLQDILARKERAALSRTHLLAALPRKSGDGREFLLIDRRRGMPTRLTSRPPSAESPEGARLWDALHARFAGEL